MNTEKEPQDLTGLAVIGAVISLFLPGLGLLLSKNNKWLGILIFIVAIIADAICVGLGFLGFTGFICVITLLLFIFPFVIPVIHIIAAIHSFVVISGEKGDV